MNFVPQIASFITKMRESFIPDLNENDRRAITRERNRVGERFEDIKLNLDFERFFSFLRGRIKASLNKFAPFHQ